ncbi:DUF1800 family protein [Albirhodobacter sp. R86504]|uniref:DUF1800 domain-containing protein n=1 Tax=Albirhodobacter sp. R86504 TaxID=3093848 RepID=UPI00366E7763
MEFSTIAAARFGYGPSPYMPTPANAADYLTALRGGDAMAERFPIFNEGDGARMLAQYAPLSRAEREGQPNGKENFKALRDEINDIIVAGLRARIARAIEDPTGLRERLHQFWTDHFTVVGRSLRDHPMTLEHQEFAVRPHMTGRFGDLLKAAATHSAMLTYLDQHLSIGPNSAIAKKRPQKNRGLNENLAREVMELHSLGVEGGYSQDDVRQLAELFTGMTHSNTNGFDFRPGWAEPGAETVLGKLYGGGTAGMADIHAVLDDLAVHPDTAAHIARKLAVHFTSDAPSEALIAALREAYMDHDGALMPVYEVLLTHPDVTGSFGQKIRQPLDFIATALRTLGVRGEDLVAMPYKDFRPIIRAPMQWMGQKWIQPAGPDGWPEEADAWISPQELAARIEWSMRAPQHFAKWFTLPDSDAETFMLSALGERASPALKFAVPRAESRAEAIGLVLASSEFNRR